MLTIAALIITIKILIHLFAYSLASINLYCFLYFNLSCFSNLFVMLIIIFKLNYQKIQNVLTFISFLCFEVEILDALMKGRNFLMKLLQEYYYFSHALQVDDSVN